MEMRALGSQGLSVSALGLGCMGMSEFYGAPDEAESIATIHRALDLGVNFLDTADMYGPFTNEQLVGRRSRAAATRWCWPPSSATCAAPTAAWLGINGRPEYVRPACDASLKRLGVDHIDLYYQHRVDPTTPIEETVGAMAELVRQGKVRYLGLSEAAPATIRRAHAVHPITALQTEYSLWTRDPEDEILPTVRELGIGFVAYSPLGRGFLTGQITHPDDLDARRLPPPASALPGRELRAGTSPWSTRSSELAAEKDVTPAQLALAWVLAPGRRHRADPRHQAPPLPGGERPRAGDPADPGGSRPSRRGRAEGGNRRRALFRHEPGQPLVAVDRSSPAQPRGSVKKKRVPTPALLSTPISPPWASTMPRAMASPSPAPPVARLRDFSPR